jgi:hypothetical protein
MLRFVYTFGYTFADARLLAAINAVIGCRINPPVQNSSPNPTMPRFARSTFKMRMGQAQKRPVKTSLDLD